MSDSHAPAQELLDRLLDQLIESGAENYQESVFNVELGSEQLSVSVILQHKDKPSVHELRAAAEKKCEELQAKIDRLKADRSACWAEFKVMSRSLRAHELDTVKVSRELLERHLDEVGEYKWDTYDELRVLLGKESEA